MAAGPMVMKPAGSLIQAIQIQASSPGRHVVTALTRAELLREGQMASRDLHVIDPSFQNRMDTILAKPTAILLNLGDLRAAITAKRMLLFDMDHPLVASLIPKLEIALPRTLACSDERNAMPFEFACLEVILDHFCTTSRKRFEDLHEELQPLLDRLAHQQQATDMDDMRKLLWVRNRLLSCETDIREARTAVGDVLAADEDMASMYLTMYALTGHHRLPNEHREVEELFEDKFKQLVEIENEISEMKRVMDASEDIFRMIIDSKRNAMIKMSLLANIATVSMGTGATVGSIFGMNLMSSLETSPHAFAITASCISLMVGGTFYGALHYCKSRHLL
eukprot:jgi/Mesvir1/8655/Mv02598-RA.1